MKRPLSLRIVLYYLPCALSRGPLAEAVHAFSTSKLGIAFKHTTITDRHATYGTSTAKLTSLEYRSFCTDIMTSCPFCNIAEHFPPSQCPSADLETVSPSAFVVLSTPLCLAFLDIMPLSPGHLLLTPRKHYEKVSDIPDEVSRELGMWLSRLSRVLASVTGVWDFNIVQNNGAAAAQVVPHCHYHLIPRPALTPELRNKSFTMFGRGQRSEIDDDEAAELARKLRDGILQEVQRLQNREKL